MTQEEYAVKAMTFAQFDNNMYPFWAVLEELGEFAGKIAKSLRGDKELDKEGLEKEAGDVMWQLNACMQTEFEPYTDEDTYNTDEALKLMEVILMMTRNGSYEEAQALFEYMITECFDMDPDAIRQLNIDKLTDRKERNAIRGTGDSR